MARLLVRRSGRRWLGVGICLLLVVITIDRSRDVWVPWVGEWLVTANTPKSADLIVVLGGDFWGHRVERAAELVTEGYAPRVMISGPDYRMNGIPIPEGELAIRFLVQKGYPRDLFFAFPHHAFSTIEEAKALAPELRRRKAKRILIVTSNYHSRRASLVFHTLLPFSEVHVLGVPEEYFQPEIWWKSPVSRELVQSEWSKIAGTIAYGLFLRLQALTAGAAAWVPELHH